MNGVAYTLLSWLPTAMRNLWGLAFFACVMAIIAFVLLRSLLLDRKKEKWVLKHRHAEAMTNMPWHDFENLVVTVMHRWGFKMKTHGGASADGGIDAIAHKNNQRYLVQCKRYKGNVGVAVVREMYGVMHADGFDGVYIFTSSSFSRQSIEFAKNKPIKLISGTLLAKIISDLHA